MIATLNALHLCIFLLGMTGNSTLLLGNDNKGHFEPGKLTQFSDIVLVGQQISQTVIRVEQVWKGAWDERLIEIPNLAEYESVIAWPRDNRIEVSKLCLVFVSFRRCNHIVANGLFRVQADGRLLGYRQVMNPGPYGLMAESKFDSLEEVKKLVDAAEAERPVLQRESLRRLSSLFWDDEVFVRLHPELVGDRNVPLATRNEWDYDASLGDQEYRQELTHLAGLTSVADEWVFAAIDTMLGRNKEWDYWFAEFLCDFPNPTVERSLIDLYEQSGEMRNLSLLGRLGLPSSARYLKSVAMDNANHEHQHVAIVSLSNLCRTMVERLDDRAALSVALELYALMDEAAEPSKTAAGTPSILAFIRNPGSVVRLKQFLDVERIGNRTLSQIQEREGQIQGCKKFMAAKRGVYTGTQLQQDRRDEPSGSPMD